jgi:uncharacterized membrane protein
MQSINVTAVRAPFMLVFGGTALVCRALIVVALTIAFHVPRNDTLGALAPDAPGTAAAWATYLSEWTGANHVRAAAGLLSAAALGIAVTVG